MSPDDLVLSLQRTLHRVIRHLRRGSAPERTRRRLLIVQIDGLSPGRARRACRRVARRAREQPLRPDRLGPADRPGRQERDPDRRVRPEPARGRRARARRRGRRRAIGTTLFGGMLAATLIGIFLIPALYAAFQIAAERLAIGAPRWPAERGREPARVGIDPTAEASARAAGDG